MKKRTVTVWYMPDVYTDPNAGTARPDYITAEYPPQGQPVQMNAKASEVGLIFQPQADTDRLVVVPWHRIVALDLAPVGYSPE